MATAKKPAAAKATKNLPPKKTVKGGVIIDGGKPSTIDDEHGIAWVSGKGGIRGHG